MNEPVKLILDTDIETDCDDIGALAVIHALVSKGDAELLAVICDTGTSWGCSSIELINDYYGRSNIPIGTLKVTNYEDDKRFKKYLSHVNLIQSHRLYTRFITKGTYLENRSNNDYPDAVKVYRKTLAHSVDGSVVICAIGLLTALEQLLKSQPDENSSLSGYDLVKLKVKKLVSMANCKFPYRSKGGFNWEMDNTASRFIVEYWPTPIAISSSGDEILTGSRLLKETSKGNPIRQAYETWLSDILTQRCSWDQIALLYAVWGEGIFFVEETGYTLINDKSNDEFTWVDSINGRKDINIKINSSNSILVATIEELMIH